MKITKSQKTIFVLILVLFALASVEAQQIKTFSEATGSGKYQASYDFDKWNFSVGKNRYEIRKNGKAKKTDSKNRITNFRIMLDKGEQVEGQIYFYQYKNDLILVCETAPTFDSGAGFIARLDRKTHRTIWKLHIPTFNIVQGLIEGNSAYLAASGFAAKINLDTGKYLWKHKDFYRKYKEDGAFNIFGTPRIEGNIVTFTENQDDYKRPPNLIKFNKTSGKVIEVKVN